MWSFRLSGKPEGKHRSRALLACDFYGAAMGIHQLPDYCQSKAEAAVLEAQNLAMAKAAIAEAHRIEAEKRAELEAPAKAEKAKLIVEAEAAAEKKRIGALAEAAANYAQLEAEARGQYEILAKKGEGLRQIIDACGGAQQAFQLLMLEHMDHLAETASKAISNIKFDKVVVWDNPSSSGASATSNFLQSMARSLPPMLQVMQDIGGVQMPEYLAKLHSDSNGQPAPAAVASAEPVVKKES